MAAANTANANTANANTANANTANANTANASPQDQKLTFHDLLVKYTDRNLIREMPRVVILDISDKILESSDHAITNSKVAAASMLLNLPPETMVLIFEQLPQYYRPNLAKTCKALAELAKLNDLLELDPSTSRLLDGVKLRKIENGRSVKINTTAYPKELASRSDTARCDLCNWRDLPASSGRFQHAQTEGRRLKLDLTKGMLWVLAYKAIRRDMQTPYTYFYPVTLDQLPKADIDKRVQGGVRYYETQLSRVVSDVIKQDSYGYLKWKK